MATKKKLVFLFLGLGVGVLIWLASLVLAFSQNDISLSTLFFILLTPTVIGENAIYASVLYYIGMILIYAFAEGLFFAVLRMKDEAQANVLSSEERDVFLSGHKMNSYLFIMIECLSIALSSLAILLFVSIEYLRVNFTAVVWQQVSSYAASFLLTPIELEFANTTIVSLFLSTFVAFCVVASVVFCVKYIYEKRRYFSIKKNTILHADKAREKLAAKEKTSEDGTRVTIALSGEYTSDKVYRFVKVERRSNFFWAIVCALLVLFLFPQVFVPLAGMITALPDAVNNIFALENSLLFAAFEYFSSTPPLDNVYFAFLLLFGFVFKYVLTVIFFALSLFLFLRAHLLTSELKLARAPKRPKI